MTFTHRLSFLVLSFIYASSLWWSLSHAALTPGTLPLAVRSPYLNCWESSQSTEFPALNQWPTIWSTESQVLGWEGLIRVDNTPYRWLGLHSDSTSSAANATNATAVSITPTRTIVTIPAGPMTLNVTFLSPIEPGDYVRQSMPFSYLYLEATSNDGKAHSVQVYSDISGEWNSGNRNDAISWTTTSGTNSMFHAITLDKQTPFTETANQAEWGTMYHAGQASSTATYQIAADATNRGQFTSKGNLLDTVDPNFRQISNSFPVFGISQDLGTITSTQKPVVWAVGFTRDQAVQYTDLSGVAQNRSLYYKANFTTDGALIDEFILDFPNAVQRAQQLDSKILTAAQNISSDYADIVSLAARQVFAATELTISQSSDGSGSYNTSDVMIFMKNIGGASEGRVNAVETLFASFPMFMFIDPTLGAPLLEPLLRFQNSPAYKSDFAAADIGSGYPVAKATTQGTSQLAVEQTANMIIMAAAHARATGDGNLVATYYDLLKGWTDYLVNNTLFTSGQFSADQNTVSNQTNLALKGIVAIKAMSQLSTALGNGVDAQLYATESTNLFAQWESLAVDPSSQALLDAFGQSSSFTLGYNLFADLWLGTNLVNSTVLAAQTASYGTQAQSVKFGLPTDSTDTTDANAGWNMFAAGIATDPTVRDQIVSLVHARASSNSSGYGGFPSVFSATAETTTTGIARYWSIIIIPW
ncbi:uncharacterized protein STEHIDRAFT_60541 [Stereum hirsutum FP-91666 SS1]|uniref:uncharacterized protein n=1 Tax=Stereum hirsutum (strain FP-91666) TaxID=721885 RepID=UPI0004449C5E|nr:uncharacterized protein STEHIDRAFT_60541 [Stereum hirsutum FP-91666 SS1]EIM84853.1 hypothetical protein STEHIDRAFT_60541 [Stereum hirsutum FP-91666 SS1]